jgi:iduronate 2-sulfatase
VKALNISFPFGPMPTEFKLKMKQHYYAAVTYVDSLVGEILKVVDFQNTVVVLTSDHGWSLGEHAEWSKYSNFDVALNVPLVMYSPNLSVNKKKVVDVVSLLDVFPTLVDLAGLPHVANCPYADCRNISTCTEGKSLLPLVMGTANDDEEFVAFSQYPRPAEYPVRFPNSDKPKLYQIRIMGYSIRTHQFRYTAWIKFTPSTFERDWTVVYGEELYDHSLDPKENMNLISRSELNFVRLFLKERLMRQFP